MSLRIRILEDAKASVAEDLRIVRACRNRYACQRRRRRVSRWRAIIARLDAQRPKPKGLSLDEALLYYTFGQYL
jgi:hypothetical protein